MRRAGLVVTGALAVAAVVLWVTPRPGAQSSPTSPTSPTSPASPPSSTAGDGSAPAGSDRLGDPVRGRELYLLGCSSCHGPDGGGVDGRGPTLREAGAAAADFYLSTGRMPAARPGVQNLRKTPAYPPDERADLVAYVATLGDGPAIPDIDLEGGDLSRGQQLYTANCAACHNAAGSGGALGQDHFAPRILDATPLEVAEAARIGPGTMPVFGPGTLPDEDLEAIVRYVRYLEDPDDPGGAALGRARSGHRRARGLGGGHGVAGAHRPLAGRSPVSERTVAAAFVVATLAALGLGLTYVLGGQAQWEGALLGAALGGIGLGLSGWSKRLFGTDEEADERPTLASESEPRREFLSSLERGEADVGRRRLLVRLLALAGGALGLAALFPLRSLGPAPGDALRRTAWRAGARVTVDDGVPVRASDLEVGSVLTVFPEGAPRAEDSATLLIRVEEGELRLPPERLAWAPGRPRGVLQDLHPRRLPGRAVPAGHPATPLPLPPIDVRCAGGGPAGVRTGDPVVAPAAPARRRRGLRGGRRRLPRADRARLLEPRPVSGRRRRSGGPAAGEDVPVLIRRLLRWTDDRIGGAGFARKALDRVFPDHWSFLLGEIVLYCFVLLVATGVYLTFFFEPSTREVVYDGPYQPLQGVEVSAAYASALELSFEVRAGLVMRQMHHWAALLFLASMTVHLGRVFFTGAFRRPRELNWVIGVTMMLLSIANGFFGYSLLDDLLSGTGLRVAYSIALAIPFIGPDVAFGLFGGEFPSADMIPRFYGLHVLILPALIASLLGLHLALVWRQKHTQFAGPGRREGNVVGYRLWPAYAFKSVGLFFLVAAVVAALGGLAQINPVWAYGPFQSGLATTAATSASQPDWYMGWLDGALRIFPPWELRFAGFELPNPFFPGVLMPTLLFAGVYAWPFLEARVTGDHAVHHLLDRPRDAPGRSAVGAAVVAFYAVLFTAGSNDVLAGAFGIAPESLTTLFRVLVIVGPVVAFFVTRRLCRELSGRSTPGEAAGETRGRPAAGVAPRRSATSRRRRGGSAWCAGPTGACTRCRRTTGRRTPSAPLPAERPRGSAGGQGVDLLAGRGWGGLGRVATRRGAGRRRRRRSRARRGGARRGGTRRGRAPGWPSEGPEPATPTAPAPAEAVILRPAADARSAPRPRTRR